MSHFKLPRDSHYLMSYFGFEATINNIKISEAYDIYCVKLILDNEEKIKLYLKEIDQFNKSVRATTNELYKRY